jgi:hypothetical protein
LDPKLMFWGISDRSITAEVLSKASWTRVINAQVRTTMKRSIFLLRTHKIHPIGPQTHVLGRFRPFH